MNRYFYIDACGQQCGPVAGSDLKSVGVTKDTPVWCEGMPLWEKAGHVPELATYFVVPPYNPSQPPVYVAPKPAPSQQKCPSNHLVWAILVTMSCCLPFGLVAIINASKVEDLWNMGMREEAIAKAKSAKKWCWAGFLCGGIVIVTYLLIYVLVGVIGIAANL